MKLDYQFGYISQYGHKTHSDSDTITSIECMRHGIIEGGHVSDDGLLIRMRNVNI